MLDEGRRGGRTADFAFKFTCSSLMKGGQHVFISFSYTLVHSCVSWLRTSWLPTSFVIVLLLLQKERKMLCCFKIGWMNWEKMHVMQSNNNGSSVKEESRRVTERKVMHDWCLLLFLRERERNSSPHLVFSVLFYSIVKDHHSCHFFLALRDARHI